LREQPGGTRSTGGNCLPFGDQEAIGGDAQCCVMMEAAPPPPFEMAEPHLLFEFLIVALNAPPQLGDVDEIVKGDVTCKGRKPVFGRRVLTLWPFDQEPFFRSAFSQIIVAMRYSHTHPRKARGQHIACALAPLDRTPCSLWQSKRKLLGRDRLMLCVPPDELGWPSVAGPFFGRQRPRAPCHTLVCGMIPAT